MHREARRLLAEVLHDVGAGETVEMVIRSIVHHRRSLNEAEMAVLSPEWLAIPARHNFTQDGITETRL